jgi:hypothetical protein
MNPKEFIKTRLNELRNFFPELSFKYKFNKITSTHIVDVRPVEYYESNEDYIRYEANFCYEFDNKFFPESIMFISEDSLTKIKDPDFVFNANQFSEDLQPPPITFQVNDIITKTEYISGETTYALAA